ncbi:MAG: hypothetical protein B6I30_07145 [Desulfobacteraceae bacterium 4572_187]|nr:MAG: hypothetical protein B6I30_07145 [Desulfobacteraceae bacterium 4572_187]
MQQELPKIRTVHMTNLYLSVPENLEKFLREFRQILKDNYQIITVEGEERYACGQEHTKLNPDWVPFKHLERYCLEQGLDDFEVRDFLEEYLQRPIICECDILIDRREERKMDLIEQFGMDFEGYDLVN